MSDKAKTVLLRRSRNWPVLAGKPPIGRHASNKHSSGSKLKPAAAAKSKFGPPTDAPVPTPSETLLAKLGSCMSMHIHADAASASIAVRNLELGIEADLTQAQCGTRWAGHPGRSASKPLTIGT